MIHIYFEYGEKEIAYLSEKDTKLKEAIEKIGIIERPVMPDVFTAVVYNIIGQQISTAALNTVWARLEDKLGDNVTPENIVDLDDDELQSIGITYKKVGYIKNFAVKVRDGEFDIEALYDMTDEEAIKALSSLAGIGKWTAEMILIFAMQRADIVSEGDLAIIRGMRMLYHHREIDKKKFAKYKRRYSPYGSVASLYLWEIAAGAIPGMKDYKKTRRS